MKTKHVTLGVVIGLLAVWGIAQTAGTGAGTQRSFSHNFQTTYVADAGNGAFAACAAETVLADGGRTWSTSDKTFGISLANNESLRLSICGDTSVTPPVRLSAAGNMRACIYDPIRARWMRAPAHDRAVGVSAGACEAFGDINIGAPFGRAFWYPDGVTLVGGDGGYNINVQMHGFIGNTRR